MANIYDQISVPELQGEGETSLEEYLEPERESPNRSRRHTAKQFCHNVLKTREYRESLIRRIDSDELPPQIESMLYHYAYGKPVERVEFNDVTESNLERLSEEELDAAIAQRLAKRKAKEQQHQNLNDLSVSDTQH